MILSTWSNSKVNYNVISKSVILICNIIHNFTYIEIEYFLYNVHDYYEFNIIRNYT